MQGAPKLEEEATHPYTDIVLLGERKRGTSMVSLRSMAYFNSYQKVW